MSHYRGAVRRDVESRSYSAVMVTLLIMAVVAAVVIVIVVVVVPAVQDAVVQACINMPTVLTQAAGVCGK